MAPLIRPMLLPMLFALAAAAALPYAAFAIEPTRVYSPTGNGDDSAQDPTVRRMFSSLAILMLSGLLVLVFAIGAYLLIRVGRAVAQKPPAAKPTEYVDAWSKYRLSEADVEAAMRDLQDGHGGHGSTGAAADGPPGEPDPQGPK